ncbi:MAG: hypothetical protein ACRD3G_25665 [Vicinamibacterales bacterium]
MSRTVSTSDVSAQLCPRCESTNTIRVQSTLRCDSWHCYACGRSFDVLLESPPERNRRSGDMRTNVR